MTNIASKKTVTLIIGKAEALILFELLHDFHRQPTLEIKDDAERLALVRVHGALESALVEPFSKDYGEIISAARRDLLQQEGDPLSPQS
jgi:hypothetical protein